MLISKRGMIALAIGLPEKPLATVQQNVENAVRGQAAVPVNGAWANGDCDAY